MSANDSAVITTAATRPGRAARPVLCVVGARPNYMKMAPIMRALSRRAALVPPDLAAPVLVHTGQHYDPSMNESFFEALGMPRPAVNLEVGSASHAVQTAEIMKRFEPVLDAHDPAAVLVVGDVNSTVACALVASKKGVPVVHVEAGLRSYDRTMPEEINRVLTDQIADVLYTTERAAHANLAAEGIAGHRIAFVGNVMIDTLLANRAAAVPASTTLRGLPIASLAFDGASPQGHGVVTLHRPSNVDDRDTLQRLLGALCEVATRLPLVMTLHPRTRARIDEFGLSSMLAAAVDAGRIALLPPQGYLEMLGLMKDAALVLTDSGGLQEETTALGVPCLTLRENTERPITIDEGTNTLCGTDARLIVERAFDVLATGGKRGRVPELWDGHAADRIATHLARWLGGEEAGKSVASRGDDAGKSAASHGDDEGMSTASHGDDEGMSAASHGDDEGLLAASHGDDAGLSAASHGDDEGLLAASHGDDAGLSAASHGDDEHMSAASRGDDAGKSAASHGDDEGLSAASRSEASDMKKAA